MTMRSPDNKWTDEFNLSRDPISLEDTISPEFFQRELEAIFRKSWLYVGREERVLAAGTYFTKEFEPLKTSVLITRDKAGKVHAFHNVCPHRGNKLVWDTHAEKETSGRCARFLCKFHGVAFGSDGKLEMLTDEVAWLGDQGRSMRLAELPLESWNGFLFVNLNPGGPKETLREYLGEEYWNGFDFPYSELSSRYSFTSEANANWKALMDGFSEVYHAATTHALPFAAPPLDSIPPGAMHLIHMGIRDKHRYYVTPRMSRFNFPYEELTNALGGGPRYPFPDNLKLPPAANPTDFEGWGTSSHMLWPNLYVQFYHPGWFLTYLMHPLSYNKMRFELDIYLPPAKNFSELLAQKSFVFQFLEAALQDFSLLEAQQLGLEARAFDTYPLTDQEVLLRDFHVKVAQAVDTHELEHVAAE